MLKKLLGLLTVFILVTGLLVSLKLSQQNQEIRKKAARAGVILGISPSTVSVAPNETFTVGITVNTGDETVSAAELRLSYNASTLEAQSITAGNFLPVVLTQGQINEGNISITLGSQPTDPKKGSGIFATISFKALAPSASNINFASSTQVAAVGKTGNRVQSTSGSQITVNTSPSATPLSPTATPTPPISSPVSSCPRKGEGDANCDGEIDGIDYSIWLRTQCRPSGVIRCANNQADYNKDGNIDDDDYKIWFGGRE